MDLLCDKLRHFRGLFAPHDQSQEKREVTRFEGYFQLVHKILTWQDVSLTMTVFLVLNFIFWAVIQLELKCFGVVSLLALTCFVGDFYADEITFLRVENEHLKAMDQWKTNVVEFLLSLKSLRKGSPASFCIAMIAFFLAVSFIARNLSGYVIFYLMLLGIFFVPLAVQQIPEEYVAHIKRIVASLNSEDSVIAEEELMPTTSQDKLVAEKTTELFSKILTSMPSHLDVDEKDSLVEDDFLPSGTASALSFTPGTSDSDSDHKEIRFETRHFVSGDSSSEEDNYGKSLEFPSVVVDTLDSNREVLTNFMSNVASVGGNIVANVMKMANAPTPQTRKDSSSDSDFEIINTEDLDH